MILTSACTSESWRQRGDKQRQRQTDTHLPLQLTAILPLTLSVSLAVSLTVTVSLTTALSVIVLVTVSAARLTAMLLTRATVVPLPGPFPPAEGPKALKRIWNHDTPNKLALHQIILPLIKWFCSAPNKFAFMKILGMQIVIFVIHQIILHAWNLN